MGANRRFFIVVVLVAGLGAGACRNKHPYVWAKDLPASNMRVESIPLRPGDRISVQVARMAELQGVEPFVVNADGSIVLPLVGVFEVEGLTPAEAAEKLDRRLQGMIVEPQTRISVVNPRTPSVTVVGEVRAPATFEVPYGEGLLSALARAGGLTEFANPEHIYVVRKYPQRQRIRFRYSDLTGGVQHSTEFQLHDGDVIVVE